MISCLFPSIEKQWREVRVKLQSRNKGMFRDWVHLKSGDLYQFDTKAILAWKSVCLAAFTPLYCTAYLFTHLLRGVFFPLSRLKDAFATVLTSRGEEGKLRCLLEIVWELPKSLIETIWIAVKTPFYCLALQFAALYGITWSLLEGRALFALIEKSLHGGKTDDDDLRMRESEWRIGDFLCQAHSQDTLFLGLCFQPLGNLSDTIVFGGERKERFSTKHLLIDGTLEGKKVPLEQRKDGSWAPQGSLAAAS